MSFLPSVALALELAVQTAADQVKKSQYIPAFDGLRAVSILAVLAFHGLTCLKPVFGKNGWLGVDIFFVISGFLITRLALDELTKTGKLDWKSFYRNRILRIAPAFYFMLAVYALWNPFHSPRIYPAVGLAAVHLTDYDIGLSWGNSMISGLAFCWSLAVEEKYYLLFPLLMLLYSRLRSPLCFAGLFILCQCWKPFVIGGNPDWTRFSGPFDMRFDTILAGCMAACFFDAMTKLPGSIVDFSRRLMSKNGTWLAPALLIGQWYWMYHFLSPVDPQGFAARSLYWIAFVPGFSLCTALLLTALASNHEQGKRDPVTLVLSLPPMIWMGRISYSLYLWHGVGFHLAEQTKLTGPSLDLIKFFVAVSLASASFYFVERPFLKLKDKLKRSRETEMSPAVEPLKEPVLT